MENKSTPFIQVVPRKKGQLKSIQEKADFYLETDNWNDFGYYTTYNLYADGYFFKDQEHILIGSLQILRAGQTTGMSHQLKFGPLEYLGENYCSMPNSLDYYERLSKLPRDIRNKLLKALRDLIIYPEIKEVFKHEEGYKVSLLRNIKDDDQIFELAPILLSRDYSKLQNIEMGFTFSTPEMEQALEINFDSPRYGDRNRRLPNRISVLIGNNGSGKSTLLNRLSRIAYASTIDRNDSIAHKIGNIKPEGLGFTRIITLSYSAFDSFNTPGFYKNEKLTIIKELKNGLGRYVFCGIRDIVRELELIINDLRTDENDKLRAHDIINDRSKITLLKSNIELASEFSRNISNILDLNLSDLCEKAFTDLREESSLHDFLPDDLLKRTTKEKKEFFENLSTGHKFVLHAITSIIAFSAPRALFLFDEPETHLHPPMLAVLMKAVRRILNERDAFMIIATHSPIILQETLHQHVSVIRKQGTTLSIKKPEIQTFGENIGILTQLAFGLTTEITDYHDTLIEVVKELTMWDENKNIDLLLEEIDDIFENGLSTQSRSFIISYIYKNQLCGD